MAVLTAIDLIQARSDPLPRYSKFLMDRNTSTIESCIRSLASTLESAYREQIIVNQAAYLVYNSLLAILSPFEHKFASSSSPMSLSSFNYLQLNNRKRFKNPSKNNRIFGRI